MSHVIVLFHFIEEAREKGEGLEEGLHGGPLWEPLCYAQISGLGLWAMGCRPLGCG